MFRITPLKGELIKVHKNSFISLMVVFSLLIWPILSYFNVYFTYMSFDLYFMTPYGITDYSSLMVFIITGLLGYYSFWCMVQSAWLMGYERQSGTLEMIMLTPANRLLILYGRALGALVEHIWMFVVFTVIIILYNTEISLGMLVNILLILVVLVVSATIWGGLINALFLFSRDATFLFNAFDTPMELFSGVKIPIASFPIWARVLSVFFPLTHCLVLIREVFFGQEINLVTVYSLIIILVLIVLLTLVIVKSAEKNSRKKGTFTFY